jgi:hypothetical protein
MKGRDHLYDIGIYGRLVSGLIFEVVWKGMDRIHQAQDRDQW